MATVEGNNRAFDRTWRYALLVLGAVIFIGPLLFMVMSSLKPDAQLLARHLEPAGLPAGGGHLALQLRLRLPAGAGGDLHLQLGAS